jgi:hypothetical protein
LTEEGNGEQHEDAGQPEGESSRPAAPQVVEPCNRAQYPESTEIWPRNCDSIVLVVKLVLMVPLPGLHTEKAKLIAQNGSVTKRRTTKRIMTERIMKHQKDIMYNDKRYKETNV